MKTINLWKWSLGAVVAVVLPFLGCSQKNYTYQPAPTVVRVNEVPAPVAIAPVPVTNNVPPPNAEERSLEDAPVQVVSTAQAPTNTISPAAAEIVKLAQSGVDEGVMLTYVTNSARVFNLTSDDLVYLNDVGVSPTVVTAMLQRDQLLKTSANVALATAPQAYTNPIVTAPGAPTPYTTAEQPAEVQQETAVVVQAPEPVAAPNVSYTYFYDSLSPYGTWVDVDGYGRCWRPTVVVVNPGWQPYCDSGRWVYSDCGWYWASDYSWGWAPFHYGRWFRHSRMGWCWAPDTVWGPSWVSWRYTDDYCGWAPLPPAACYTPGVGFTYYGRSVGVSFSFGLTARHYAFVPVRNFYDRHPGRYRLPEHNVINIYNRTTVIHTYEHGDRGRIINRGIPVEHVRTAAHADIRPITIRDTDRPGNAHIQRDDPQHGRTLDVFRPPLPQPHGTTRLVGEGVQPATRQNAIGHANTTTRSPQAIRAPQSEPNRPTVRNTPAATHESIRNPRDRDRDNQNDNR
ncbi:MAG TPA: DUF6600 domain-containing protein, partial [Candidatus Paceibacterota bacterium]|nr:DUF6600 domain-containing protein [Candidatus Paceibacterota bacterium]